MLRLILVRHAKSSWDEPELADYDRPLNARGREAAPRMGEFLAERWLIPTRILCSAAQRARETLASMLPAFGGDIDIRVAARLYDADAPGYLEAIREFGGTDLTLMLIGHNPATEDLAQVLAPIGDAAGLEAMKGKYPTAGVAVIGFETAAWRDIGPGGGTLLSFHTPKSIVGDMPVQE